jgi:hypothetical protein
MLCTLFVRKGRVANARKTSYILQLRRCGFIKRMFGIQVPTSIYRQNFGKQNLCFMNRCYFTALKQIIVYFYDTVYTVRIEYVGVYTLKSFVM